MSNNYLNTIDEFKKARIYWENKLSGELKELKLFRDFPGTKSEPYIAAHYSTSFDIIELVTEVKDMLYGAVPRMITISTELPDDPCFIVGDPDQIHQCILNL
ncbi:MAG: hypothetical protein ACFFG0_45340, partial [Candidatus Thorarchaeota archaeon]